MLLAAVVSAVLLTAVLSGPAHANEPGTVSNRDNGFCLQPVAGLDGVIGVNGLRIAQIACNGMEVQLWLPLFLGRTNAGDRTVPYYYIVNRLTNKCLDVRDASGSNGATIQQWDCNGGRSEFWAIVPHGSGFSFYLNFRTRKCLDVPDGTLQAVFVQQWECTASHQNDQLFTFPA